MLASHAPEIGGFLAQISEFYIKFYHSVQNRYVCVMHDPTALVAITDRTLFTFKKAPLSVTLSGEKIGNSHVASDSGRRAVNVCIDADVDAVRKDFSTFALWLTKSGRSAGHNARLDIRDIAIPGTDEEIEDAGKDRQLQAADAAVTLTYSLLNAGFAVLENHPISADGLASIYDAWGEFLPLTQNMILRDPVTQDGFSRSNQEHAKGADKKTLRNFTMYIRGGRCLKNWHRKPVRFMLI